MRTARSARDHTGTRAGSNGRRWPNGLRLLPGRPTASRNRVARGGTQGGPNCLTHALPRCLPTPTEEADGNGYGVIAGRRGPSRPPPRASVNLVPLLLTGVRLHPPGRTDKHLCRCFGAPATHARRPHGRVFPDHLITREGNTTRLASERQVELSLVPAASPQGFPEGEPQHGCSAGLRRGVYDAAPGRLRPIRTGERCRRRPLLKRLDRPHTSRRLSSSQQHCRHDV